MMQIIKNSGLIYLISKNRKKKTGIIDLNMLIMLK